MATRWVRSSAPMRRGAAPYADGCSHSIGAFTLHFPAPFCSTRAELAADMARFCVRHDGAKSPSWSPCVLLVLLPLFLEGIWPLHARHPQPSVTTPGEYGYGIRNALPKQTKGTSNTKYGIRIRNTEYGTSPKPPIRNTDTEYGIRNLSQPGQELEIHNTDREYGIRTPSQPGQELAIRNTDTEYGIRTPSQPGQQLAIHNTDTEYRIRQLSQV